MKESDRKRAINELKKICHNIGCSGMDPDMCQNKPYLCSIIRKICSPYVKNI